MVMGVNHHGVDIVADDYLELAIRGDLRQFEAKMVKHPLDYTAVPDIYDDRTPLHLAALHGQVEIVKCILSSPSISDPIVNAKDRFGYTPLHLAVRSEHESIVRILTSSTTTVPDRFVAATSERDELGKDCDGFTPLHVAAAGGSLAIVKLLLQQSCRLGAAHDNIHVATWQGITALDIAKKSTESEIVEMLECCDVNWLQLERQKSANSINAILVGAALVATVTFGCWLQPPSGIQDPGSLVGAEKKLAVVHVARIGWFFVLITCSFAFSIMALVIGTAATISSRSASLKTEVRELRSSVLRASIFLFLTIDYLVWSFMLAGSVVFRVVAPRNIYKIANSVLVILLGASVWYIFNFVVLPKGVPSYTIGELIDVLLSRKRVLKGVFFCRLVAFIIITVVPVFITYLGPVLLRS